MQNLRICIYFLLHLIDHQYFFNLISFSQFLKALKYIFMCCSCCSTVWSSLEFSSFVRGPHFKSCPISLDKLIVTQNKQFKYLKFKYIFYIQFCFLQHLPFLLHLPFAFFLHSFFLNFVKEKSFAASVQSSHCLRKDGRGQGCLHLLWRVVSQK